MQAQSLQRKDRLYNVTPPCRDDKVNRPCRGGLCMCCAVTVQELGWKREDIVVSTKVFWGGDGPNDKGLSRKHIIEGTRNCLKRLQLDYV